MIDLSGLTSRERVRIERGEVRGQSRPLRHIVASPEAPNASRDRIHSLPVTPCISRNRLQQTPTPHQVTLHEHRPRNRTRTNDTHRKLTVTCPTIHIPSLARQLPAARPRHSVSLHLEQLLLRDNRVLVQLLECFVLVDDLLLRLNGCIVRRRASAPSAWEGPGVGPGGAVKEDARLRASDDPDEKDL